MSDDVLNRERALTPRGRLTLTIAGLSVALALATLAETRSLAPVETRGFSFVADDIVLRCDYEESTIPELSYSIFTINGKTARVETSGARSLLQVDATTTQFKMTRTPTGVAQDAAQGLTGLVVVIDRVSGKLSYAAKIGELPVLLKAQCQTVKPRF